MLNRSPEPPPASLALYRALVACHLAGAVLAILSMAGGASSVVAPLQVPLLLLAIIQLVAGIVLFRRPLAVPRLILGWPRTTWAVSVGLTLLIGGAAVSYAAFPFTLAAACWVSTAAAVGPRRGWPILGAALAIGCLALWRLYGRWDTSLSGEVELVAFLQLVAVFVNAAWMGAAGSEGAMRLRRWGLIVAADDGALQRLRGAGATVRKAAQEVLDRTANVPSPDGAIAARQLAETVDRHASPTESAQGLLEELARDLRVPFAVEVEADAGAELTREQWAAVRPALLRHLTNVVRHAPAATRLQFATSTEGGETLLSCDDNGGGPAPNQSDEGTGSQISRDALSEVGGTLTYTQGAAGVRLELRLPGAAASSEPASLGLAAEVRGFADLALRNNRLVAWFAPLPPMIWAFGAPWQTVVLLIAGGVATELTIRSMGPSGPERGPFLPLLFVGAIAVALAGLLSVAVDDTSIYPAAAATAYPIIEVAWRRRWRLWVALELARGLAVLPWVLQFGAGAIVSAYVFPLAATLIVLGAERLVRRADELDRRLGGAVAWRRQALEVARDAALRHDVVDRLRALPADAELDARLVDLDRAAAQLASVQLAFSDPIDDSVGAAQATLAPLPLHVTRRSAFSATTDERFAAFSLVRRLDRLEAAADASSQLVAVNPARWYGAPSMASVDAAVTVDVHGEVRLTLTPQPSGTSVEAVL